MNSRLYLLSHCCLLSSHNEAKLSVVHPCICDLGCPVIHHGRSQSGNWIQAEPTGCATKCGVAAGASGTPGAVTCSTSSCDADAKPAAKQCPKTEDCGACDEGRGQS